MKRIAFLSALALLLLYPALVMGASSIEEILDEDGRIDARRLTQGEITGQVNVSDYDFRIDPNTGEPVFYSSRGAAPSIDDCWSDEFPLPGANQVIADAVVYNGMLVVGGSFQGIGSIAATGVAGWDGTQWHAIGANSPGAVSALAIYNGDLIAGGSFDTFDGSPGDHIARWDGSSWSALGSGANG
ncbi:MAG: hypothetical protein GF341_09700, partial [candidate division Zixibacteria bacterium]|nr:hypothetical protein [candidate division Zixibacteria bacterium]